MVDIPPATTSDLRLVAAWPGEPTIAKWLDFGPGRASPSAVALKAAITRGTDVLFTFSSDRQDPPIGVTGFTNVHERFSTAMLWHAPGDPRYSHPGPNDMCCDGGASYRLRCPEAEPINAWNVAQTMPP